MISGTPSAWRHALAVTRPALDLAEPDFLDEIAARLRDAGVVDAVARRDPAPVYDWLMTLVALQGISDQVAFSFDAAHGGIAHAEVAAALAASPSCPRLRCYWSFAGCGYRKGSGRCAEPHHRRRCPLPRHPLRKGALNVASYSLFLFVRDVCCGDFVSWIDARLAAVDLGANTPDRTARLRGALLDPLGHVAGVGPKLWPMLLAELLLVGDPARERWAATGASMVAVDSLVHNFLHRTGILHRLGAAHPYGPACYSPDGCAAVIEGLAQRLDARAINPAFPATFPRFVQHAVWQFCAGGGFDVCNGNRINDRARCQQVFCPAYPACDRVALKA